MKKRHQFLDPSPGRGSKKIFLSFEKRAQPKQEKRLSRIFSFLHDSYFDQYVK